MSKYRRYLGPEGGEAQTPAPRLFPLEEFIFLLSKAFEECFAVDGLHLPAFQIVITTVEHSACRHKVGKVSGHGVLNQFLRRTSSLIDQLVNLGLQLGREMYFHISRLRRVAVQRQAWGTMRVPTSFLTFN